MIDHHPFEQEQILRQRGFTLVEVLVAMAVLGLLVVMLAQAVGLTSQAIFINAKKLDAAGQARLVFDRLATDLAARPRRTDLATLFTKAAGNDSLYFYSQVDGYSGAHKIAAVGYRVQQTTSTRYYQLERGAVGTDWVSGISSNPVVQFMPNTMAIPSVTDETNYEVLASGVFRLEFCYLLNTGVMSNTGNTGNSSNVVGLVVALGVLDAKSLKIVSSTQLGQLSAALPDDTDTSGQCQDPLSIWNTALAQPTFAPAGVPPQVIQNIRLYQRTFYVP